MRIAIFALLLICVFAKQIVVKKDNACIHAGPLLIHRCVGRAQRGYVYHVFGEEKGSYKLGKEKYIEKKFTEEYVEKEPSSKFKTVIDKFKLIFQNNTDDSSKQPEGERPAESLPRPTLGKDVVYYAQGDKRWGDIMYSKTNTKSQTIRTSGCGPTSMAMAVATLSDGTVTPPMLCDYALKKGFRTVNSGTEWGFFCKVASKYGLKCKQTHTTDDVVKALKEKDTLVVASMGPGYYTSSGHYILLHGTDGKQIYSHDPAKATREKAKVSLFKSQAKVYFIISK